MMFMTVLVLLFAATWLLPPRGRWDLTSRWRIALGLAMGVVGILHIVEPSPFVQHLPTRLPGRLGLVYATGVLEIALGAALVATRGRRRQATGLALAAFLIAVFPANVYVAISGVEVDGQPGGIYPWLRLPMQALFIWLALWTTRPGARSTHRPRPRVSTGRP